MTIIWKIEEQRFSTAAIVSLVYTKVQIFAIMAKEIIREIKGRVEVK